MKTIKFLSIVALLSVLTAYTDEAEAQVLDGAYAREQITERPAVPLQHIREADAMYSKRVLRVLDLREKQNLPLYLPINAIVYPGVRYGTTNGDEHVRFQQPQRTRMNMLSLIYNVGILGRAYEGRTGVEIPLDSIKYSRLPVYYNMGPGMNNLFTDWYRDPIAEDDNRRNDLLAYEDIGQDSLGNVGKVAFPLDDTRCMDQLWMWEEWVFDKQRSVMDVRIIAMSFRGIMGSSPIWNFWIYYPDYRPLLARSEVFNTANDAERNSFDDIMQKRLFSSYIVAETNVYDNRLISDYLLGIEALREGERIQEELFMYEHDQWEF